MLLVLGINTTAKLSGNRESWALDEVLGRFSPPTKTAGIFDRRYLFRGEQRGQFPGFNRRTEAQVGVCEDEPWKLATCMVWWYLVRRYRLPKSAPALQDTYCIRTSGSKFRCSVISDR